MKRALTALAVDLGARFVASLLLGMPLVAAVSASGIGHFQAGDRLLFEPGGLYLAETGRVLFASLVPLGNTALVSALVLSVCLLLPHGALLAALADRDRDPFSAQLGRATAAFPALLSLSGLTLIAQGLVLVFFSGAAGATRRAFGAATPPVSDGAALVTLGVGVLVALLLGVARDLCRASAVVESSDGRSALKSGLSTLKRHPVAIARGYLVPALAGLALFGVATLATEWLDVSRPGAFGLPLVIAVHVTTAVGLALCRARWLATAVVLVEAQPDASSIARR